MAANAPVSLNVLDLPQNWDTNTPGFARYTGPSIEWIKRVAFEGVGGMEITSTLHVGTHLDAPNHLVTNAKGIGELPIEFLVGPGARGACQQEPGRGPSAGRRSGCADG
jgi:arylformamidase